MPSYRHVEVPSCLFNHFHNQLLFIFLLFFHSISTLHGKQSWDMMKVNEMLKKRFLYRVRNWISVPFLLCCDWLYCDVVSMYIVHISTLNNNSKELSFTVKLLNAILIRYICYKNQPWETFWKSLGEP